MGKEERYRVTGRKPIQRTIPALPGTEAFRLLAKTDRGPLEEDTDEELKSSPKESDEIPDLKKDVTEVKENSVHTIPSTLSHLKETMPPVTSTKADFDDQLVTKIKLVKGRFYPDRGTVTGSYGGIGFGVRSAPKSSEEIVFQASYQQQEKKSASKRIYTPFTPAQVFPMEWASNRENLYNYGLTVCPNKPSAFLLQDQEEDEKDFVRLVAEMQWLRSLSRQKLKKDGTNDLILGITYTEDSDLESRIQALKLEIQRRKIHKQYLSELREKGLKDNASEARAWMQAMREAQNNTTIHLDQQGAQSDNTSLKECKLYQIFMELIVGIETNRLLTFPRLLTWSPVVLAMKRLDISKREMKSIWRSAHKNRCGGDRGRYDDFCEFGALLDDHIASKSLGPKVAQLQVKKIDPTSVKLSLSLDGIDNFMDYGDLALARTADYQRRYRILVVACNNHQETNRKEAILPSYKQVMHAVSSLHENNPSLASRENPIVAATEKVITEEECGSSQLQLAFDEGSLLPETEYNIFAIVVPWSSIPHSLAPNLHSKADKSLAETRLQLTTCADGGDQRSHINSYVIHWPSLTAEQQRTELLAALKSKEACAAARALNMDIPAPSDAMLSVQQKDPEAKRRWQAWAAWWPQSGAVRENFCRQEILFAAKNSEIRKAAKECGIDIDLTDVALAADGNIDKSRKRRWSNFQRWYCGMPILIDESDSEEENDWIDSDDSDESSFSDSSLEERNEARNQSTRRRQSSRTFEVSDKSNSDQYNGRSESSEKSQSLSSKKTFRKQNQSHSPSQSGASQLQVNHDQMSSSDRYASSRASPSTRPSLQTTEAKSSDVRPTRSKSEKRARKRTSKKKSRQSNKKAAIDSTLQDNRPTIFDPDQAASRLVARNNFLNARTSKVNELRAAIEKVTKRQNEDTTKKRHLKAVVKMIMFQIKMQKTLLPTGTGPTQLDAEIDIFAEVDENALLQQLNDNLSVVSGENDSEEEIYAPVEPPLWAKMDSEAQQHEIQLAAYNEEIIELAIDSFVPTPEIEDWVHVVSRTKRFSAWYLSRSEHRSIWFRRELIAAGRDTQVCQDALAAGVRTPPWTESDARRRHEFEQWYARSVDSRNDFLNRLVERLSLGRRALALRRNLSFAEKFLRRPLQLLRIVPGVALIARQPPLPKRYTLYPSRTPENWSAAEILQWYDADTEAGKTSQAISTRLKKWRYEKWLSEESQRQAESRLAMAWEDERASRLRAVEIDIVASDTTMLARAADYDAKNAENIVNVLEDRAEINDRLVYASHLSSGFLDGAALGQVYALGSGLQCVDEDDTKYKGKMLAAEELAHEHEMKLRKREEDRKRREEEERKQKENEETRRRIKRSAEERKRILEELSLIRKNKSEKRQSNELELEAERAYHIKAIDADIAAAVVAVAQAKLASLVEQDEEEVLSFPETSSEQQQPEVTSDTYTEDLAVVPESTEPRIEISDLNLRFEDDDQFDRAYIQSPDPRGCYANERDSSFMQLAMPFKEKGFSFLPRHDFEHLFAKISRPQYALSASSSETLIEHLRIARVTDSGALQGEKLRPKYTILSALYKNADSLLEINQDTAASVSELSQNTQTVSKNGKKFAEAKAEPDSMHIPFYRGHEQSIRISGRPVRLMTKSKKV